MLIATLSYSKYETIPLMQREDSVAKATTASATLQLLDQRYPNLSLVNTPQTKTQTSN